MAVITVSRQYGSEGGYIARQAAQTLGYHFIDKEFIGSVLREYGVNFGSEYDHIPSFWEKFIAQNSIREEMVTMLNRVIWALAQHGNVVILGRSSYVVLGNYADVLNVRIQAPLDFRVKQVMKRQEISVDMAEELIRQGDKVRSEFVKTFYGAQWEASSGFDLVINTSKIAPTSAITWLVEATNAIEVKDKGHKPITASIEVASVLEKAISQELEFNTTT